MTNRFSIRKNNSAGFAALSMLLVWGAAADTQNREQLVEVSGVTEFEAPTNMPAVSVKGKSSATRGRVTIARAGDGMTIEHIDVTMPIKSLTTGMSVRDEHMRKLIFTGSDGQAPDLRFEAENAECPSRGGGQEFACIVSGELSIRSMARPLSIQLKIRQAGQSSFKAAGEAVVRLSDYEITQPTQFGVKVANEVKLRLEFTGRERPAESSSLRGAR
jgi:polyisoprenoid-binding protein YceI